MSVFSPPNPADDAARREHSSPARASASSADDHAATDAAASTTEEPSPPRLPAPGARSIAASPSSHEEYAAASTVVRESPAALAAAASSRPQEAAFADLDSKTRFLLMSGPDSSASLASWARDQARSAEANKRDRWLLICCVVCEGRKEARDGEMSDAWKRVTLK